MSDNLLIIPETNNTGKNTGLRFIVKDCGGFPDCLYFCLLFLLKEELSKINITNINNLRNYIAYYLENNKPPENWKEDYNQVLSFQKLPSIQTWNEYITLVKTILCGGTIEINALCNLLPDIQIRIITLGKNGFYSLGSNNPKRIIRLLYNPRYFHYQSLILNTPFLESGIPSLPTNISYKSNKIIDILDNLISVLHNKVYLTSYGGKGKTTIALIIGHLLLQNNNINIDSKKDYKQLLKHRYYGGIIWIKFGKGCTLFHSSFIEKLKDLIRILDYSASLSQDILQDISFVNCAEYLLNLSKERNILFIFDDIWDSSIIPLLIKHIDTSNGILITSRDKSKESFLLKHNCYIYNISPSLELAMDIFLLQFNNTIIENNKDNLIEIATRCHYIPLLIILCSNIIQQDINNIKHLLDKLPIIQIDSIKQESLEVSLYHPIINVCFQLKQNIDNTISSSLCSLDALQSLSIFPRRRFPLEKTLLLYWQKLFSCSKNQAKLIFDNLINTRLITINELTQQLHIHDVLFDTIQSNTEKNIITNWKNILHSMYYDYIINKANKKNILYNANKQEWTQELVYLGPQDGYFFLHLSEITNNTITYCVSFKSKFAKIIEYQDINPKAYWKLFKYCKDADSVNENKFLSISNFPWFNDKSYRPSVYISATSDWSYPYSEKLGLIHLICIYGTPKMLEKVLQHNIYLNTIAESSNTQRMPMEIVLFREEKEMAELLLKYNHIGMHPVASCSPIFAKNNNWSCEGNFDWSCLTALHASLYVGYNDIALSLINKNASMDEMSGGISFLHFAITNYCNEFVDNLCNNNKNLLTHILHQQSLNNLKMLSGYSHIPKILYDMCMKQINNKINLQQKRNKAILEGTSFKIIIRNLTGKEFPIDVINENLIFDVKELISMEISIAPEFQRLIFAGKQLENGRQLTEYNIKEGDTLHLVLRLRGG